MPKLEPKQIQKELDEGYLWPVYWLYGAEKMKSREIIKRIKKNAHGSAASSFLEMSEETLDAGEISSGEIFDRASTMTLGGDIRILVIRDAHELSEPECLIPLMTGRSKKEELSSLCIFVSKDLDQRKKFSKTLIEKTAVVLCEEVPESEREAWIDYLAKRRGLLPPPELATQWRSLDQWSLDIIDQELEKFSLYASQDRELQSSVVDVSSSERFIEAFFNRNLQLALENLQAFASQADEALPLLGLLTWNARQLALYLASRSGGAFRPNPYLAERLRRWSKHWSESQIESLHTALLDLDFASKQTARLSLGLWTNLALEFCPPIQAATSLN